MNIAIIGLGSIGQRHLDSCVRLKDELGLGQIRAFDLSAERRGQAAAKHPAAAIADRMVAAVDGADAVFICTPTSNHISVIEEMSRGRRFHLFIEKPLAHTLEGCDEMIFAQQRSQKVTAVGYLLRFHPVLRGLKRLVTEGALGRVLSVRAESGFFLPQWHPWEDYRDFYMSWKTGGGGALLDTSHEINYLQWLCGPMTTVKGYFDHISDLEITSDDLAIAVCRFASGAYGQIHLDLLQFDECRYCKVIGTEAVATADLIANTIRRNKRGEKEWISESFDVSYDRIYEEEVREFITVCRAGGVLTSPATAARETLGVVEAIRRSHALGVEVRLPLYS
jgi:predicted dehydrogenase